ncbi:hypothetical protein BOTBODRAFT_615635 [Botryobasidium botryosum FD-172 SS1]|uniref:Zn(2)-C6 fungal-type domain-containing protein n=1 Tax=Botryobasidium botryosum (strain FD-172 SS1) TaxID=930990 RepID=A0A067M6F7_BOTB1|nr:hypothetical protein BOTBODRAFT_615635 [Botryobasidium botryosum FD-172 SS1]
MNPAPPSTHSVLNRGKACIVCRRKKQRCDAKKPTCTPCLKSRLHDQCDYDPAANKPWVRLLQNKLKHLEDTVRVLQVDPSPSPSTLAINSRTPPFVGWVTGKIPESLSSPHIRAHHVVPRQPGPLDAPLSLKDPLPALLREHVPVNLTDLLITNFLQNRWQHVLEFNTTKFLDARRLPPSHPNSVHPALLDAMCLLGCMYSPPAFQKFEPLFLHRLRYHLATSLANVDRLFDFLMASALTGCFYYMKARIIEAHHCMSTAIRFAMACGLHRIDTYDLCSSHLSPILAPPESLIDLGDRIYMFWGLFCLDRAGSLITGFPAAFPDDKLITTMWPCPLDQYATVGNPLPLSLGPNPSPIPLSGQGEACGIPYSTVSDLHRYSSPDGSDRSLSGECVHAFRAKSFAMLYRAAALATRAKSKGELARIAGDISVAEHAIQSLSEDIASYRGRTQLYTGHQGHDATLILATTATYAAYIQLLNIYVDGDSSVYQHRLEIARASMAIVNEASAADRGYLHILLGLTWTPVYEVLALELKRLLSSNQEESAKVVSAELDTMLDAFRVLAKAFPFKMDLHVSHLERFKIHSMNLRR